LTVSTYSSESSSLLLFSFEAKSNDCLECFIVETQTIGAKAWHLGQMVAHQHTNRNVNWLANHICANVPFWLVLAILYWRGIKLV
jgi:hypothetical protein